MSVKLVQTDKELEFSDISAEKYREYVYVIPARFPQVKPAEWVFRIDDPIGLHVSASGGHRVFTPEQSFYVQPGWKIIRWENDKDTGPFRF